MRWRVEKCDVLGWNPFIILAQGNDGKPVVTNLHGWLDPHEPFLVRLQILITLSTVCVGNHTLTITSAGDCDSVIVLVGLYCL